MSPQGSNSSCQMTCVTFGDPWQELINVTKDINKRPTTVRFTYSWIQAGTRADDHSTGGSGLCVDLEDHVDGSVDNTEFKREVRDALDFWRLGFESLYPWLTLQFVDIGNEAAGAPASDNSAGNYAIGTGGTYPTVGDLRFGMHGIDGNLNAVAHAYNPGGVLGSVGNVGGDLHFDSAENWRLDQNPISASPNAFSVKYVAAHEIGHILGIGHSTSVNSIMAAGVTSNDSLHQKFANGISAEDLQCIICIYGQAGVRDCCPPSAIWSSNTSYTSNYVVRWMCPSITTTLPSEHFPSFIPIGAGVPCGCNSSDYGFNSITYDESSRAVSSYRKCAAGVGSAWPVPLSASFHLEPWANWRANFAFQGKYFNYTHVFAKEATMKINEPFFSCYARNERLTSSFGSSYAWNTSYGPHRASQCPIPTVFAEDYPDCGGQFTYCRITTSSWSSGSGANQVNYGASSVACPLSAPCNYTFYDCGCRPENWPFSRISGILNVCDRCVHVHSANEHFKFAGHTDNGLPYYEAPNTFVYGLGIAHAKWLAWRYPHAQDSSSWSAVPKGIHHITDAKIVQGGGQTPPTAKHGRRLRLYAIGGGFINPNNMQGYRWKVETGVTDWFRDGSNYVGERFLPPVTVNEYLVPVRGRDNEPTTGAEEANTWVDTSLVKGGMFLKYWGGGLHWPHCVAKWVKWGGKYLGWPAEVWEKSKNQPFQCRPMLGVASNAGVGVASSSATHIDYKYGFILPLNYPQRAKWQFALMPPNLQMQNGWGGFGKVPGARNSFAVNVHPALVWYNTALHGYRYGYPVQKWWDCRSIMYESFDTISNQDFACENAFHNRGYGCNDPSVQCSSGVGINACCPSDNRIQASLTRHVDCWWCNTFPTFPPASSGTSSSVSAGPGTSPSGGSSQPSQQSSQQSSSTTPTQPSSSTSPSYWSCAWLAHGTHCSETTLCLQPSLSGDDTCGAYYNMGIGGTYVGLTGGTWTHQANSCVGHSNNRIYFNRHMCRWELNRQMLSTHATNFTNLNAYAVMSPIRHTSGFNSSLSSAWSSMSSVSRASGEENYPLCPWEVDWVYCQKSATSDASYSSYGGWAPIETLGAFTLTLGSCAPDATSSSNTLGQPSSLGSSLQEESSASSGGSP